MSKSGLRRNVGQLLASVASESRRRQSQLVLEKIVQHPRYQAARALSVYLSTDAELDTLGLVRHALEVAGKRCFVPFVAKGARPAEQDTRMLMVELASLQDLQQLPLNHYGIREPRELGERQVARPAAGLLELAIVPGVAFSADCSRLGHGRGYYDEFLADWALRSGGRLYTLGLALEEQMVAETHAVAGADYLLDEVITATRTYTQAKRVAGEAGEAEKPSSCHKGAR